MLPGTPVYLQVACAVAPKTSARRSQIDNMTLEAAQHMALPYIACTYRPFPGGAPQINVLDRGAQCGIIRCMVSQGWLALQSVTDRIGRDS